MLLLRVVMQIADLKRSRQAKADQSPSSSLKWAVGRKHGKPARPAFARLFQERRTHWKAGEIHFAPITVSLGERSEGEKKWQRGDLERLLTTLG